MFGNLIRKHARMASSTASEQENDGRKFRLGHYKRRTWKNNQESRRNALLNEQKKRREDSYDAFRDFRDVFNADDDGDDADTTFMDIHCGDAPNEKSGNRKFPRLKDLFMFSEWMTELPGDLQDKWVFIPCPVGKRCLVRSSKGSTSVYGQRGYQIARFRSSLPSGGYTDESASKYSKSNVTVLDCIWNSKVKKYFVLDILYWKSQSYLDTDIKFRSFWTKSKIEEIPCLLEKSKRNPYPFVPLNCYNCDAMTMSSIMSNYPYFEFDVPKVDGILFYHAEGYYTPGVTPLALWLKPFMIPEVMGQDVCVSECYLNSGASDYTDMFDYIKKYEMDRMERKVRKRRWKRRKSPGYCEEMDVAASDAASDGNDCEFHLN